MIQVLDNVFLLQTDNTSYVFSITKSGHLEHLHYGDKITIHEVSDAEALMEKHEFVSGNLNVYDKDYANFTLEDIRLEFSSYGKGDIREPFVSIKHKDGGMTSDFIYESHKILDTKEAFETLPGSYSEDNKCEHLLICLKDRNYGEILELHYYVYQECDVITRSSKLINTSDDELYVNRLMSTMVDYDDSNYDFVTFNGAWVREMKRNDASLKAGKLVNQSFTGTSSNRANPFVILKRQETSEENGECYGYNLIYSGNHYEVAEVSSYGKLRFVSGINPEGFFYKLEKGQVFEAPEAVMTYSDKGLNAMSHNLHYFVNEHIVRGKWKNKVRPIVLNSWEAAYFDINEKKLINLAKAGKKVGIELFVMDDGWFGERNDDSSSLGDWTVNKKKLPGGLKRFVQKINDLGMDFGIWVEPEMVNVNSKLYKLHPDWVIDIPGKNHSEGRNQRILDLGNPYVQEYIIEKMHKVFSLANISYVKWDMNRTFTDYYSKYLDEDRQGEVFHRYVMGLYHCMKVLTESFPNILFEGCSAGGNRFDLGILCYFPQIWASDDTDALCRTNIQQGYSYGYPMSTISAHVSGCPNHQTLRTTPIETRFNVAAFGVCGYETNLADMSLNDLEEIKSQIEIYKKWRGVLQFGDFYRLDTRDDNKISWTTVSKDKDKAVGMIFQKLVNPNMPNERYIACGLDKNTRYHLYNRKIKYNVKNFGDLVNTVSPIHIKQDSFAHNLVAKLVKMDGELEDYTLYGDAAMKSGVRLKQGFAGTGYNDKVRYYQDFASRMYFIEEMRGEKI